MKFYAVVRGIFGKVGSEEQLAVCASREEAVRIMNHLSSIEDDDSDPLHNPNSNIVYSIRTIPVNLDKLRELGII